MEKSATKTGMLVLPSDVPTDKKTTLTPLNLKSAPATPLHLLYTADTAAAKTLLAVVQLTQFNQPYGSWIIAPHHETQPPHLCHNGNVTIVTRVDPLFVALPVLDSHRLIAGKDAYQPLSTLAFTQNGVDLSSLFDPLQMILICDVKHAMDDQFYHLSDEKVLSWLVQKHTTLLKHKHVGPTHAFDLVAQYLTPEWEARLRDHVDKNADPKPTDLEGNESVEKTEAVEMAMSLMLEDARACNQAERQAQITSSDNSKKKATKKTVKPPIEPSSSALKFWATQKKKSGSAKKGSEDGPASSAGKRKRGTK